MSKIIQIQNINEKNLLLILCENEIKIYNLKNNKLESLCLHKWSCNTKIFKINSELFILFNDITEPMYGESLKENIIHFLKIEYNSRDESIKMNLKEIKNMNFFRSRDMCVIHENNIISIHNCWKVLFLSRTLDNKFYIRKETILSKKYNYDPNYIVFDKINMYAIIYYSIDDSCDDDNNLFLDFYKLNDNFELKKELVIKKKTNELWNINCFKLFNKENYICCNKSYNLDCYEIYIISSKYLECVNIFRLKNGFDSIHILNNLNQIIINNDEGVMACYKFINNDLQLIDEQNYNYLKIYDIIEINEKGDYMLITYEKESCLCCIKYKCYIFKNNNKTINNNLILKMKDKHINNNDEYNILDEFELYYHIEHCVHPYDYDNYFTCDFYSEKDFGDYDDDIDYYEKDLEYQIDFNILLLKKKKDKYKKKKDVKCRKKLNKLEKIRKINYINSI